MQRIYNEQASRAIKNLLEWVDIMIYDEIIDEWILIIKAIRRDKDNSMNEKPMNQILNTKIWHWTETFILFEVFDRWLW